MAGLGETGQSGAEAADRVSRGVRLGRLKQGGRGLRARLGKETPGGFAGDLGGPSAAVARG